MIHCWVQATTIETKRRSKKGGSQQVEKREREREYSTDVTVRIIEALVFSCRFVKIQSFFTFLFHASWFLVHKLHLLISGGTLQENSTQLYPTTV